MGKRLFAKSFIKGLTIVMFESNAGSQGLIIFINSIDVSPEFCLDVHRKIK